MSEAGGKSKWGPKSFGAGGILAGPQMSLRVKTRIAADAAARPAIDIIAAGTLARNVAARCLLGVGALRRDQDKERARKDGGGKEERAEGGKPGHVTC